MRPFVRDRGDDRDMIIGPARERDAGGLAGRRVASLGGDQQGRGEQAPVLERDADPGRVAHGLAGAGGHEQGDALRLRGGLAQGGAEQAVLDHRPERVLLPLAGIEQDAAGPQPLADPDRADRAGHAREPFGDAERLQHAPGRARHRGRAAVIGRGELALGRGGIDDERGEAVAVEREREAEADQPAAEDDDVRALHFPPVAMQPGNAKRLTRDSPRAQKGKQEHLGHSLWRSQPRRGIVRAGSRNGARGSSGSSGARGASSAGWR